MVPSCHVCKQKKSLASWDHLMLARSPSCCSSLHAVDPSEQTQKEFFSFFFLWHREPPSNLGRKRERERNRGARRRGGGEKKVSELMLRMLPAWPAMHSRFLKRTHADWEIALLVLVIQSLNHKLDREH